MAIDLRIRWLILWNSNVTTLTLFDWNSRTFIGALCKCFCRLNPSHSCHKWSTFFMLQNNNPYISAQVNDGSRNFDHQTDGSQHAVGGCMRDYRNKPYPVKAKIRYENNVLTVSVCQYYKTGKGRVNNVPSMRLITGNSRNTQSKSYALSS